MSIGPASWSGVVGSLASTPTKNASTDRAAVDATAQLAAIDAATRAAADGVLQENEAAGDRDGDGRDAGAGGSGESPGGETESVDSSASEQAPIPHGSLDATGDLGHHLDLDG